MSYWNRTRNGPAVIGYDATANDAVILGRSAITWNFREGLAGDPDAIAAGDTRTLTYGMAIPSPSSIAGRMCRSVQGRVVSVS